MLAGFIITSAVGVLCAVLGILVYRGHIKLVHSYHTANVKKEDKPAYCKSMGKAVIIIGFLVFALGLLIAAGVPASISAGVYMALFAADFVYIYIIQRKYNGGMFG